MYFAVKVKCSLNFNLQFREGVRLVAIIFPDQLWARHGQLLKGIRIKLGIKFPEIKDKSELNCSAHPPDSTFAKPFAKFFKAAGDREDTKYEDNMDRKKSMQAEPQCSLLICHHKRQIHKV